MQPKRVVAFDSRQTKVEKLTDITELSGKLSKGKVGDKLMHSVLENDKKTVKDGKLIREAINQGLSVFTPDMMMEQLVKNFSMAKNIYGETILRLLANYEPGYIEKNIKIPEFQKEIRKNIEENIDKLKDDKLIDSRGNILDKGVELASLILYTEELSSLMPKGILGEKVHKKAAHYGDKMDVKVYKKGDRYKDLAIRDSVKLAVRRSHKGLIKEDLRTFERERKGSISIIYALDASGSMKGAKIDVCKKAGVALAFKAINEKDKVGLIVFGSEVRAFIEPTDDFGMLLKEITKIRASRETNIVKTIEKAIELFPDEKITKHLILITDAMPTVGDDPENLTIKAIAEARNAGITISLIGIKLDAKGKALAEKITEIGNGKLYVVRDLENIDKIVLEDYYSVV
ncbi:VWA domain-containing protein [Candidatus Woesearchaeota archaeon]|nr:VWA domain-containing protein [Candidatus Woesearchaeota archaeon]